MPLVSLPAADIPTFVDEGRVDLGITGWDQVAEYEARSRGDEGGGRGSGDEDGEKARGEGEAIVGKRGNTEVVMDLGFGKCKLQVQVPEGEDISEPEELVGRNVITSFVGLTERYFARLESDEKKAADGGDAIEEGMKEKRRRKPKTKIKYADGSVEAACALGVTNGLST